MSRSEESLEMNNPASFLSLIQDYTPHVGETKPDESRVTNAVAVILECLQGGRRCNSARLESLVLQQSRMPTGYNEYMDALTDLVRGGIVKCTEVGIDLVYHI